MSKTYDVIIIGAGIGGLTAGNFLAKSGCSTLIIEQHSRPGGCVSSFERKGFKFDAAVHWISQCGEDGVIYNILKELGIERKIDFVQINPLLEVAVSSNPPLPPFTKGGERGITRYVIPKGRKEAIEYLKNKFQQESNGIDRFFDIQGRITSQMYKLFEADPDFREGLTRFFFNATFPLRFSSIARYHRKIGADVVDGFVKDSDLRRILKIAAIFPKVSMVMLSWFWNIIYSADGYYPKGGMQGLSDLLARNFKKLKGEILYNNEVSEIITVNGQAKGMRLSDNKVINAKTVISNADARQTFLNMLNGAGVGAHCNVPLPKRYIDDLKKWRLSESFFYVYLGVDMDLSKSNVSKTPIIWYFPERKKQDIPEYIGIGIPSLTDKGIAPKGKHTIIIGAFGDAMAKRWFESKDKIDKKAYKKWKEEMADLLIELTEDVIPGLKKHIVVKETASPLTFYRYTRNSMGASSGWSMDADQQNKLSQKTPIKNLFLAGHWTFNPGGVPSAFMTGRKAAELAKEVIANEK